MTQRYCHGLFDHYAAPNDPPRGLNKSARSSPPTRTDPSEATAAARKVARYLQLGHPVRPLFDALTEAVVREDADFHTFQMVDAGFRQHALLGADHPDGRLALVAATRYMVAQKLRRNVLWSTQNALKLARGEGLEGD